jgi:hypothetical protein
MRNRTILLALAALAILALLAVVIVPRLTQPKSSRSITYWPTQGWQTATRKSKASLPPAGEGYGR